MIQAANPMSKKTEPSSPEARLPKGLFDISAGEIRATEEMLGTIRRVFESYGFEPLETPAVENIETLTGKYGEEGNKLIFKILRRGEHEASGEADLALRYDLTVPLARVIALVRRAFEFSAGAFTGFAYSGLATLITTAILQGGNHGDEYEGMEAIRLLFDELDPAKMRGTFIGVGT